VSVLACPKCVSGSTVRGYRSQALMVRHTCARLVTLVPGLCEITTYFSNVINSADTYNIYQSRNKVESTPHN